MSATNTLEQEPAKVHYSLDVSPDLNATLDKLANSIGGTKGDVLLKAIVLLDLAVDAKRQGKKFGVAEKDQPLAAEITGF
jgi:hypothetical protein